MPEQALGGIPQGFVIVVENEPSELSCNMTFMLFIGLEVPEQGMTRIPPVFENVVDDRPSCYMPFTVPKQALGRIPRLWDHCGRYTFLTFMLHVHADHLIVVVVVGWVR